MDFFDPPPPLWTILLNRAYVVIWTFGKPPSPYHVHMVYECPLDHNPDLDEGPEGVIYMNDARTKAASYDCSKGQQDLT